MQIKETHQQTKQWRAKVINNNYFDNGNGNNNNEY